MEKIKLPYNEYGYMTTINIAMAFLNSTKDGNKIKIYNQILNKDKIDMKLCHHTYVWNPIKKQYDPEEKNKDKINFMVNIITITEKCDSETGSGSGKKCNYQINLINHKNPITKKQQNIILQSHELVPNNLIRSKLPDGKYETVETKSDFIESSDNGNQVKLNFEVENDLNNEDVKAINFFFGDSKGKKNFIFYWNPDIKMYISKNNICVLLINKNKDKFLMNSTIFSGIVKNYGNYEIKKSYKRIRLEKEGNFKIRFNFEDGFYNFLFKSEDNGFNLIFKNTPKSGGSKFFIWNSNKKMYTNDKFLLTMFKMEDNTIKARLNNVENKKSTLDNGTIHESMESIFLEDGLYNVYNNNKKTILVSKGEFEAAITKDNIKNIYKYNNVLKGYTTKDSTSQKFLIFVKEDDKIKLMRYHSDLTKEESIYIVKSERINDYFTFVILYRITIIVLILIGIYLAYLKITKGHILIDNDFFNVRFII